MEETKYCEGLGIQTRVGDVIQQLFPKGFLIPAYNARHSLKVAIEHIGLREGIFDASEVDWATLQKKKSEVFAHASETMRAFDSAEEAARKHVAGLVELSWADHDPKGRVKDWKSRSFFGQGKDDSLFDGLYLAPPYSPFDLFAIVGVLLRNSGAYHHIEAASRGRSSSNQKTGRIVLSSKQDRDHWIQIGDDWRNGGTTRRPKQRAAEEPYDSDYPLDEVYEAWARILASWNAPIFCPNPQEKAPPLWWSAAYKLLCIADRASRDSGVARPNEGDDASYSWGGIARGGVWSKFVAYLLKKSVPEEEALYRTFCTQNEIPDWETLDWGFRGINTFSLANRDIACVLPKMRTAQIGCTLRSLTHSISLLPARGFVRGSWRSQYQGYSRIPVTERRPFNLLIVPYPYEVRAHQFRPVGEIDDDQRWGDFAFVADEDYDAVGQLRQLVEEARKRVDTIHGIVYPELALSAFQFDRIFRYVRNETNSELLCAGLNQRYDGESLRKKESKTLFQPTNEAIMVAFGRLPEEEIREKPFNREFEISSHQKHHRWRLTRSQIIDYGLSSSLDPSVTWWEDLRIRNRKLPFMLMRDKWAVTTLICEDLARVDPAQEIVRAVGPNLVLSLLMDGPQIIDRWPARYATILADDPGSSVLTVNSSGLIRRSMDVRRRNKIEERHADEIVIALWRDEYNGSVQIPMGLNDRAACLTLYEHPINEFTMDGRHNMYNSISLRLGNHFSIS